MSANHKFSLAAFVARILSITKRLAVFLADITIIAHAFENGCSLTRFAHFAESR